MAAAARRAKGSGRFVPVSWDEAIAAIADRLTGVVSAHGPKAILHTHYTGTCSAIAGNFPSRFFNRLGATEVDPDTVCNKAGHEALKYVFGDSLSGFDPRTAKDAACVLVWGANPSASAPHAHTHWLPETNAIKIVVDPIAHATATRRGSLPAASPRNRRGAGIRDDERGDGRRPDPIGFHRRACHRLGPHLVATSRP